MSGYRPTQPHALADVDGFDLCRRCRTQHPLFDLLMPTTQGDAEDRGLGVLIGTDDDLPKPFEPNDMWRCHFACTAAWSGRLGRPGGAHKLRQASPGTEWIETVRGVGCVFVLRL